jgi:hypothetical protein
LWYLEQEYGICFVNYAIKRTGDMDANRDRPDTYNTNKDSESFGHRSVELLEVIRQIGKTYFAQNEAWKLYTHTEALLGPDCARTRIVAKQTLADPNLREALRIMARGIYSVVGEADE